MLFGINSINLEMSLIKKKVLFAKIDLKVRPATEPDVN